jgi:hypothetical protein
LKSRQCCPVFLGSGRFSESYPLIHIAFLRIIERFLLCRFYRTLALEIVTMNHPLNHRKKALALSMFLLSVFTKVYSQHFYGLNNSNFNGVHGMYINPSSIADCRFSRHINISTFGSQLSNDYLTLEVPFSLRDLFDGTVPDDVKTPSGQIRWNKDWLQENLNGKPKSGYFGLEWRGPAGMTRIRKNMAVGFGMRTRMAFSAYEIDENLARTIRSGFDTGYVRSYMRDNAFTVNLNATQEISATGAAVLINSKRIYLKAGATVKMLFGLGHAHIVNRGVEMNFGNPDSIRINRIDMEIGHSNPEIFEKLRRGLIAASLPSFQINGFGLGYDLGATYEWRPDATSALISKNRYLLRVAASVLDIGGIRYNRNSLNYAVNRNTPHTFTEHDAFSNAFNKGIDSGLNWMKNYAIQHFNYEEQPARYTVALPSMFCLQADYNLLKGFYLGLNWNQSFVSRSEISFRRPSGIVLLPRYENRLFEFSLPLSLYNDYTDAGVGAFARVGPVFVGTDDFFRSINRSSFNGFNFYFGVSTGLPARKKKKG